MLSKLSVETGKFIPVLPYYLDVLHTYHFNKKTSKVSMKPVDFSCILRVSKSQTAENGTKDAILNESYAGILEYLQGQSCRIAFPELVIPCVLQLREFLQRCKVANYCKKVKQLLDKVDENSRYVVGQRKTVAFAVGEREKIELWERELQAKATSPLAKFFLSWQKIKSEELRKVQQKALDDEYGHIPKLNKKGKKAKADEFEGLLGNDDDSDDSMVRTNCSAKIGTDVNPDAR
jgi:nucleolar complex protein 2